MNNSVAEVRPIPLGPLPERPLVSILMPNYNYEHYIGEAIESVLQQTYQNWELIICDDGSTDNSCEVVRRYQERDSRIKLISKENGGMASALNVAYKESVGAIVCFLDADDVFLPDKIERTVSACLQDEIAGMCVHKLLPVDHRRRPITEPLPKAIDHGWIGPVALRNGGRCSLPPASGICLRHEVAELIFPIPLMFRRAADGYVRSCASIIAPVVAIPDVLALYRLHDGNITGVLKVSTKGIERVIEDFTRIANATQDFVKVIYGPEVANILNVEDYPGYWEHLLALYIMNQKNMLSHSSSDILRRLPPGKRRVFWSVLCRLPTGIARRMFELWWGDSILKRVYKKIKMSISYR